MPWDFQRAEAAGQFEDFSPFVPEAAGYSAADELEQEELTAANLNTAVDENRRYAQLLRWSDHYDRIAQQLLGFTNMTPDMPTFTQAISGWQVRNGLTPDGIVGPVTWAALQRALGGGNAAAAAPAGKVVPATKDKSRLITMPPEPWPEPGEWLGQGRNTCTDLQRQVVLRALRDDGLQEIRNKAGHGINRGDRIDRYTLRAGSPLGSFWCGIWVGVVFADCGAQVPFLCGATNHWVPFLDATTPAIGSAVLYEDPKKKGSSAHIGIVAMLDPVVLTIEGNRGYANDGSNDGFAVDLAPMSTSRRVMGYFPPRRPDGTR